MQLAITGTPGSNHHTIGKLLAERLELNFYSAHDIANTYCLNNNVPYYLFKRHKEQEADNYVTQAIRGLESKTDYVIDSLLAKHNSHAYRCCIHQDLLADNLNAPSWYEDAVTEKWFTGDDRIFGHSPEDYDITINRLYLTNEQVVSLIVDSITQGVLKANYVHPFQVLPLYPNRVPGELPSYTDHNRVFHVLHFGFTYFLDNSEDYGQYLRYLKGKHMMRLAITESAVDKERFVKMEDYSWLLKFMSESCFETTMTSYLLSKYCISIGAPDFAQMYLDVAKNANPYKHLVEVLKVI